MPLAFTTKSSEQLLPCVYGGRDWWAKGVSIEETLYRIPYMLSKNMCVHEHIYMNMHISSLKSFFIQISFWSLKDRSSNIIANDAMLAYDLANTEPHPHLSGRQTIQQSFLNCKLFEATSLITTGYFFQALNNLGSQQGLEESAQAWHSARMWPIKVSSQSQQHSPALGPSLWGYRQIGPWVQDGNSVALLASWMSDRRGLAVQTTWGWTHTGWLRFLFSF